MSGCSKKVIDVFATHDTGSGYDDEWKAPVWSVTMHEGRAWVSNWETPWVMSAFSDQTLDLEVGDLVRVGDVQSAGYTDYLTVIEKVPVTHIGSAIQNTAIKWGDVGAVVPVDLVQIVSDLAPQTAKFTFPTTGGTSISAFAYRLNVAINATSPPVVAEYRLIPDSTTADKATRDKLLLQGRHEIRINETWADTEAKKCVFPLYKLRTPPDEIVVRLDRGVKAVHWLKLIAYTLMNKRQFGFQNAHEKHTDDWASLHIREVQGEVISNNAHANGAFAVLHTGSHDDAKTGAIEIHEHEPTGLVTHYFEQPRTDLRTLTLSYRDWDGQRAHLGRTHLWFKLCVSHG